MVLLVSVVGLLFCSSFPQAEGIRLSMFVPFGPDHEDNTLERGNDASSVVTLMQSIPFLGESRTMITVSMGEMNDVCLVQ